jgi:integrase
LLTAKEGRNAGFAGAKPAIKKLVRPWAPPLLASSNQSTPTPLIRFFDSHKTKNRIPRQIPLSEKAIMVLQCLVDERVTNEEQSGNKNGPIFNLSATAISHRFSRLREKAGIRDLRIHNLRHESISRLFELGFNTMEVAAISGHQTVAMLQRYCHLSIGHLSSKLAEVSNPDYRASMR